MLNVIRNSQYKKTEEGKLIQEKDKYKYYCKCGHHVVIYPFEHIERKLCDWCGYYVYTDPKKQKQYDFKKEMNKRLKNGCD